MAVIAVGNVLNYVKAEEMEGLTEPFYVTGIRKEQGERGRKANEGDETGEMYAFSLCNADGEVFAHSKTATLGLMSQIDEFLRLGTPEDTYGPVCVVKVGKARKFVSPEQAAKIRAVPMPAANGAAKNGV